MMKTLKNYNCKIMNFALALVLFFQSVPAIGQGGYQQPVEPRDSYDEIINENPADIGTTKRPLRGKVVVAPQGARLTASLQTALSSGVNRIGDPVTAVVSEPLVAGSDVIIPSGSRLIGQVVNSIPARRFRAGSGGVLEIRFTSVETSNGQRYPLSASVDTAQFKLQAESGGSRLAKGVGKTAVGAGLGAALGTAIGAIAGGMPGRGAWSGAAIGGGTGALAALASKGSEFVINSGERIPIVLDQSLQVVVPQRY